MAQQATETAQEQLLRYVAASCAASGVPQQIEDKATLLDLARRFHDER